MDSAPRGAKRSKPPYVDWRRAVADSPLHSTEKHVALTLSLYFSADGGNAHPGADRLAKDTSLNAGTIRRTLTALQELGWIVQTEKGGSDERGRRANVYHLTYPAHRTPRAQDDPLPDPAHRTREPRAQDAPISALISANSRALQLRADPECVQCRGKGEYRSAVTPGAVVTCNCTYRDDLDEHFARVRERESLSESESA